MKTSPAISLFVALAAALAARADVAVWELPAGGGTGEPAARAGWTPATTSSRFAHGAALANERLTLIVWQGGTQILVRTIAGRAAAGLAVTGDGAATGRVGRIWLKEADETDAVLGIACGGVEAELAVQAGMAHVTVRPGTGARRLETRAPARYAVLPSFNAEDALYDAAAHQAAAVPLRTGPVILNLLDGCEALLAVMWKDQPGGGGEPPAEQPDAGKADLRDVVLRAAGEGAARRFVSSSVAFDGRPVHLAFVQAEGVWQAIDLRRLPGGRTARLDWKRPFDATWRVVATVAGYDPRQVADFLGRAAAAGLSQGNEHDWRNAFLFVDDPRADTAPLKTESFFFQAAGANGALPRLQADAADDDRPWPFVFRDHESLVTPVAEWPCYPDPTRERLAAATAAWTRAGQEPLHPPHLYGATVCYPLDRTDKTPLDRLTVVDVMRQALGIGPCKLDWLEKCR